MTSHATSLEAAPEQGRRPSQAEPGLGSAPTSPAAENGASPRGLLASGISKQWGERTVLDDVRLELEPGATAWLGGSNGVGKTTLLRIIAGLIAPNEGEVTLDGLRPQRDRRKYQSRVGLLSAGDRGLYARLSVRQNLDFWARLALLSRAGAGDAVRDALAQFSLIELADARADRISLGQRQRVRLALAFLHTPQLVLLDEPANSLDDDGLRLTADAIRSLNRRGGIAIWCSPNRPDLEQISSGYVLRDAQLERDA